MTLKYSNKLKQGHMYDGSNIYLLDMSDYEKNKTDYWNAFTDSEGQLWDISFVLNPEGKTKLILYKVKNGFADYKDFKIIDFIITN